jgi:CBS domain containing-hemolysin-like protein
MGIVCDLADEKTLGIVTLEDVLESLVGDVREAKLSGILRLMNKDHRDSIQAR